MMQHSQHNCWIFDIDGVLTNPQGKKIVNQSLLDQFSIWLQNKNTIALNTGRSLEWVKENVLIQFSKNLKQKNLNPNLLHNLLVVGEKGADWIEFDIHGKEHQRTDKEISVPQKMIHQIKELTKEQFSDTMFFDDTKKTMITIEMKQNENLDKFHKNQKKLVNELKKLISSANFTIDDTNIATDIQSKNSGKALGTQRVLDWLDQRKLDVNHFYTFGDSKSDIDMAYKIHDTFRNKKKLTFIYVGPKFLWEDNELKFDVYHYPGFNEGTLKFLSIIK